MAVLFTPPYQQFFDSNGDPLAGGKIYTYAAGTTTPKATYTAADGLTSLANPIVLDSAGRAVIFIDGSYRFDIYDSASNLIRSVDNVTNFSAIAAAASYGSSLIANYSTGSPQFFAGDATVASASTVDLWAAGAPRVTITGTTTITSLGTPPSSSDVEILVTFSGALTLTYNASTLWLPGAANIVTAAGDRAKFRPRGSTGWECVSYQRISKADARADLGTAVSRQIIAASATYTPTAGMRYADVEVIGGGGGGGGTSASANGIAAGGGAGGYARKIFTAAQIGASQTVNIGAAGTAGNNGTGGTGGTTTFGSLLQATGGTGGTQSTTAALGGAGGVGTLGDLNIQGQAGGAATLASASTQAISGFGGSTIYGAGGRAVLTGTTGGNGISYGAGGSGGCGNAQVGGTGAAGVCIITEYI